MTQCYQIQPEDRLLRWLHPGQFDWQENRPTSAAFRDDYLSVDLAPLTSIQESYERAKRFDKDAVASFTASEVVSKSQDVEHCPSRVLNTSETYVCDVRADCRIYQSDVDPASLHCINPAHGCVVGKKTKSLARDLAKTCKVEIYPSKS